MRRPPRAERGMPWTWSAVRSGTPALPPRNADRLRRASFGLIAVRVWEGRQIPGRPSAAPGTRSAIRPRATPQAQDDAVVPWSCCPAGTRVIIKLRVLGRVRRLKLTLYHNFCSLITYEGIEFGALCVSAIDLAGCCIVESDVPKT